MTPPSWETPIRRGQALSDAALVVGLGRGAQLRRYVPGDDADPVGEDDSGDGGEGVGDEGWGDLAAVAPVAEVGESFLVADRLVERLAGEGRLERGIADPPES